MPSVKEWSETLNTELSTLKSLIYKGKNQHRRTIYFKKIVHLEKCLQKLDIRPLELLLQQVGEIAQISKLKVLEKTGKTVVEHLRSASVLMAQLMKSCIATLTAVEDFGQLMSQGYFLPLALTVTALLCNVQLALANVTLTCFHTIKSCQVAFLKQVAKLNAGNIKQELHELLIKVSNSIQFPAKYIKELTDMNELINPGSRKKMAMVLSSDKSSSTTLVSNASGSKRESDNMDDDLGTVIVRKKAKCDTEDDFGEVIQRTISSNPSKKSKKKNRRLM